MPALLLYLGLRVGRFDKVSNELFPWVKRSVFTEVIVFGSVSGPVVKARSWGGFALTSH